MIQSLCVYLAHGASSQQILCIQCVAFRKSMVEAPVDLICCVGGFMATIYIIIVNLKRNNKRKRIMVLVFIYTQTT